MAIATPLGDDTLLLAGFTGEEAISRPFRFDLELLSESESIDFEAIVGQNVTVRLTLASGDDRYFNGFISRFSQSGRNGKLVSYQAEMVPWLWFLTRTSDCRIFQQKKVPDIVKQIFDEMGFKDYKLQLYGDFVEREYCVQYRETDFNFISRLLEEEGICYFFEHEDGVHTLVLANDSTAHQPCPDQPYARYEGGVGETDDKDIVHDFRVQQEMRPGAYTQADYNFEQPNNTLRANVAGGSAYEIYDYHPGEYRNSGEGDGLVKTRLQEIETPGMVAHGSSDCRGFLSGYRFELKDHYRGDLNQEWLLTSVRHTASQPGDFHSQGDSSGPIIHYRNEFECLPHDKPFRPARLTPHPVVQGSQTAVVVGPSGEEIYTDQYGRVKVQFHWDREGQKDEKSSCWVRVSQLFAGKKWGALFLPRIGQEVIVDFLEGDPDQPIITGRVYNADQMPPYALPDEKTKSTIKSNSSKGGGGFNELRFEDKKGDEQIFIYAEKNLDVRVKNESYETVEKDRHLVVQRNQFEHVQNNRNEKIDQDAVLHIGRDHHLTIEGKQAIKISGTQSLAVDGNVTEEFSANHSEVVSTAYYLKANQIVIEAAMGMTLKCGGNSIVIDPAGVTLTSPMITIDGSMVKIASGPGSSAQSGQAGSLIPAMAAKLAFQADKADPGEMAQLKAEQIKHKSGKYGSTRFAPHKSSDADAQNTDSKKAWIEVQLKDDDGNPVAGEPYRVVLPDGSTAAEGTLDGNGFARVDGVDPGECTVTFPEMDKSSWQPK